eukprot:2829688-Prymnesium_polylepis.1
MDVALVLKASGASEVNAAALAQFVATPAGAAWLRKVGGAIAGTAASHGPMLAQALDTASEAGIGKPSAVPTPLATFVGDAFRAALLAVEAQLPAIPAPAGPAEAAKAASDSDTDDEAPAALGPHKRKRADQPPPSPAPALRSPDPANPFASARSIALDAIRS